MFCDYRVMENYKEKPHDVANLLKKMLREMAEPIVPFAFYETFMNYETIIRTGML